MSLERRPGNLRGLLEMVRDKFLPMPDRLLRELAGQKEVVVVGVIREPGKGVTDDPLFGEERDPWDEKISIIVAPREPIPIHEVPSLNSLMDRLTRINPSSKDHFHSDGLNGDRVFLGRLYFDEYRPPFFRARRIWIRLYPNMELAQRVTTYERDLVNEVGKPDATVAFLKHWVPID